ncbi:hypothetical protein [Sabulicella glaciei]|uniref:hypothetical protein n=1 Tax=Sabulicella glaciei TaxID=2984948 RepID=UPI002659B972|nr:hypothetical protein [Roseococcus sp. MDT2-1-1]
MSDGEICLFKSFLNCAESYVEFGSGGSTHLAASIVKSSVVSVDSSREWLDKVLHSCMEDKTPILPTLHHVDIGPTGDWGTPIRPYEKEKWSNYYLEVWAIPYSRNANLYLIDGRFRVACFMQSLLNSKQDSFIAIHDFRGRSQYQIVHEVAQEVARFGELSVFCKGSKFSEDRVQQIFSDYEYDPN